MKSYQAHFLVAIPELADANFFRSVVLMFHHDESGASGLILNRPSPLSLGDVWDKISETECDVEQPLHIGGPVDGPLMAVHGCASLSEIEIIEGVYLSMRRENLDAIIAQKFRPFRFFTGYSGWSAEQLESEIQAGGWLSTPATGTEVFGDSDDLWKRVCDHVGLEIMFPNVAAAHHNPSLN